MVPQQWHHYPASQLLIMAKRVYSSLQLPLPIHHPRLLLLLCKMFNDLRPRKGTLVPRSLILCLGQCRLWRRSIPPPSSLLPQLHPIPWTHNGLVTIDRGRIKEIIRINPRPWLSNSMLRLERCIIIICIRLMDVIRVELGRVLSVSVLFQCLHGSLLCRVCDSASRVLVCTYSRSSRSSVYLLGPSFPSLSFMI